MATESTSEIRAFHQFVGLFLDVEKGKPSPEELVKLWRANEIEQSDAVHALREAIEDMEAGDEGRPLADVARDIRKQFGFSPLP
jgi:hypothetical protein